METSIPLFGDRTQYFEEIRIDLKSSKKEWVMNLGTAGNKCSEGITVGQKCKSSVVWINFPLNFV